MTQIATASATFDAAHRIPLRLERLGVSQNFFAEYCEIPKSELSKMLNGQRCLTGPATERLDRYLTELEEFVQLVAPLQLSFRNVEVIRNLIDASKEIDLENFERLQGGIAALAAAVKNKKQEGSNEK